MLENLIDGDVTCWGIDDVVAYGLKVAAMERELAAELSLVSDKLADALRDAVGGESIAHYADRMRI